MRVQVRTVADPSATLRKAEQRHYPQTEQNSKAEPDKYVFISQTWGFRRSCANTWLVGEGQTEIVST